MAAVNYYLGLKRGAPFNVHNVAAALTSAGTAADVELRIQINDGATATGITRLDVQKLLEIIEAFVEGGGRNHDGQFLPPL
jgi:hypothetical protein